MDAVRDAVASARAQLASAVESGISGSACALKAAYSGAQGTATAAAERAARFSETGRAHLANSEDVAVEQVKDGIAMAAAYPQYTYPAVAVATVLVIPGLRSLVMRNTIGRLQSQENAFKSAAAKLKDAKDSAAAHGEEFKKLEERAQRAAEEMQRGLMKLKAAGAELRSLQSRVEKAKGSVGSVQATLRALPAQPTLSLRSEAAQAAASLRATAKDLDTQLLKIIRHGA